MPEKLNPKGEMNCEEFIRICRAYEAGDKESAFRMALALLTEDVSDFHAAGCHLVLAHSKDCQVEHAEEALRLYSGLYAGLKQTKEQRESQQRLIKFAKKALDEAHVSEANKVPQTEAERLADFDAAAAALDEIEAKYWSDEVDDTVGSDSQSNEPTAGNQQEQRKPSTQQRSFPFHIPSSSAPSIAHSDDDDDDDDYSMLSPPPSQQP